MSFKEEYLNRKDIRKVIHVGADRGGELPQYRNMGVEEVVWVEANPEVYQELLENLELMNVGEVKSLPFNQLISDSDDIETDFNIYYGWDAGHLVGNKGMSSLLKAKNSWWGSECYKGTVKLQSSTLDTFLEKNSLGYDYDMLNMDTQGAELMVCKGAVKLLESVKYINSEVTLYNPQYEGNPLFNEIYDFLKPFGFVHIETELSGDGNWGDAVFEKK
jgi:FkbM family methyltransferase|tara:strand:+ start:753 stop:1406 length:654 start_codon:yes stop_codon:yes gene_type:complete